jgi:hypothetical protein
VRSRLYIQPTAVAKNVFSPSIALPFEREGNIPLIIDRDGVFIGIVGIIAVGNDNHTITNMQMQFMDSGWWGISCFREIAVRNVHVPVTFYESACALLGNILPHSQAQDE